MFGGLELKSSSPERKEKDESAGNAAAAFSSFSFLNAGAPAPAAPPTPLSASAAPSGFSFLSNMAPTPPAEVTVPTPTANVPSTSSSSVFDFMTTTSAVLPSSHSSSRARTTSQESVDENVSSIPAEAAIATTSSFSFLDSTQPPPPLGGAAVGSSTSVVSGLSLSRDPSFELGMSAPPASVLPTATAAPIAGAGVTFGTGLAAGVSSQPKVVKKRNRTARIGAAANAAAAVSLPPPESVGALPPRHPPEVTNNNNNAAVSSRDSALEATRRAEEFLSEKLKEQAKNAAGSSSFRPVGSSNSVASSSHEDEIDEDSIIAAARAAAEEAQHLSHKAAATTQRSYFGGLFRARGSPPAEGLSYSSNHNNSGHNSTSIGKTDEKQQAASAVDRLQKEQEENKRALAERQFKFMQQQQHASEENPTMEKPEEVKRTPSYTVPEPLPPLSIPAPPELKKAVSAPARKQRDSLQLSSPMSATAPAPAAPPTPQPKSPIQVFEEMQHSFREKVVAAMTQVTKLRQHRSGLLQERFVTLAKERLATQSKSHAEAQQMAAAESEDFETADQMSRVIEAHERERVEITAVLDNIQLALKQLEEQKSQVVQGVTQCFLEMEEKLKEFAKKQESNDSHADAEAMKVFAAVSKQLSAESERLQHDLKHLERDTELVAEERKELETAISEQAGEFERLRDACQCKLKGVETEIEELRKQLQEKQKEAARLRTEAAGHDESVLKVRVKFSRQLLRVQKKESTIQDNREEWEQEKRTHECHRDEHETRVREHSEALLARERLLDTLNKELEMVASFEEIVAKEIGFGIMTDANVDGDLAQLQADVVKCEAAVAEAKEFLKVASSALDSLEDEVEGLEVRIPLLEQIKTDAATQRDFKGAAKASKEIKETSARLKECKDDLIGVAKERQKSAEAELKTREHELEVKRSVAEEQEREQSATAMQSLADNIRRLIATKKSICAEANPNSVQGVGAYVLDSQIAALQFEGETYGDKYGGWDELMADIGPDMPPSPRAGGSSGSEVVEASTECVTAPPEDTQEANESQQRPSSMAENPVEDTEGISLEESFRKYRDLVKRLKDTEGAIDLAAESEDYEKAAELEEVLAEIMSEVQKLNLTDEQMVAALLAGDEVDATKPPTTDTHDEPPASPSTEKAEDPEIVHDGSVDGDELAQDEPKDGVSGSVTEELADADAVNDTHDVSSLPSNVVPDEGTVGDAEDKHENGHDDAEDHANGLDDAEDKHSSGLDDAEVKHENGLGHGVPTANGDSKVEAQSSVAGVPLVLSEDSDL